MSAVPRLQGGEGRVEGAGEQRRLPDHGVRRDAVPRDRRAAGARVRVRADEPGHQGTGEREEVLVHGRGPQRGREGRAVGQERDHDRGRARKARHADDSGQRLTVAGSDPGLFRPSARQRSDITKYTANCTSANGGAPASGVREHPAVHIVLVSGLTHGKTYRCTITATNARGTGPRSLPSNAYVIP